MKFYQLEKPTTKQIFDAIINSEYVPIEKIVSKAKQINILLKNHFNTDEVLVTFSNVTNTGGYPIFFSENCSVYEIASDFDKDFCNLNDAEKNHSIELLYIYTQTYNKLFNI